MQTTSHRLLSFLFRLSLLLSCVSSAVFADPLVHLETSKGKIVVRLFEDKAPATVENFLNYVRSGFYNGTVFHRIIPNFMIQGGGFEKSYRKKKVKAPIRNEAKNGLSNIRGSIAMARTNERDSATSQFFINLINNPFLDHGNRDYGYAVFGRVIEGMEVVDMIAETETANLRGMANVPKEPITITHAWIEGEGPTLGKRNKDTKENNNDESEKKDK